MESEGEGYSNLVLVDLARHSRADRHGLAVEVGGGVKV